MAEIIVQKLVKRFGLKSVLKGLDFEAKAGEFVGLLGPNGAGKTTLLRILASLSRPTIGLVKVAGFRLPQQAAGVRASLGVLSHQTMLYGNLSGEENLKFFGKVYNVGDLETRIIEVLDLVDLAKRRRDLVRTYSRGMAQRLAIARAMIHNPAILLLDEPYTGLDQDASLMLDAILKQIAAQGRTVVMTSHDLVRTAELCSRFDVLSRGKIIASARRGEIPRDGLLAFYRQAINPEREVENA
ncbi:MAG: heme ABC exporter ATP-binding protein CcmA [Anaerolineales bacterium]|nr:heme ABC exporter ATP-binding protein CcmA [Anaerolineales bacterium]